MMLRILLALSGISLCHCSIDRTMSEISEAEIQTLGLFQHLEDGHTLVLADKNEPGERLLLCLTFVNKTDEQPLLNQLVKFYHTSTNGDYEPVTAGDDSTARLNGSAMTDQRGRIYIETILPGDYRNSTDNRHIHTTVEGAHPEAYDIHFKQYSTAMGSRFSRGSDQHFLADLKLTASQTLVTFLTIEVKKPMQ